MRGELGFPRAPPPGLDSNSHKAQPGLARPSRLPSAPGVEARRRRQLRRRGGVSSTHPSPTTTHLMACIGAAARSGRAWAEGKALGGLGLSLGLRLLPPLEGTAVSAPRGGRGGRRRRRLQRRERRRQRPPPKARGGRLRRARRKQEAAAPLTSGRERSRARTTAPFPPPLSLSLSGLRTHAARRPNGEKGGVEALREPRPPAPGVRGTNRFGKARVSPAGLGFGSSVKSVGLRAAATPLSPASAFSFALGGSGWWSASPTGATLRLLPGKVVERREKQEKQGWFITFV